MTLSDQDTTDIRFYLGYSFRGTDPTSIDNIFAHNISFFLENRLLHLTSTEENRVRDMLNRLRDMEDELDQARQNLDIRLAGSFAQNPEEVQSRISLYNRERQRLAQYFNVPLKQAGNRGVQLIV